MYGGGLFLFSVGKHGLEGLGFLQYLVTSSVGLKVWDVGHAIFADASRAGEV